MSNTYLINFIAPVLINTTTHTVAFLSPIVDKKTGLSSSFNHSMQLDDKCAIFDSWEKFEAWEDSFLECVVLEGFVLSTIVIHLPVRGLSSKVSRPSDN